MKELTLSNRRGLGFVHLLKWIQHHMVHCNWWDKHIISQHSWDHTGSVFVPSLIIFALLKRVVLQVTSICWVFGCQCAGVPTRILKINFGVFFIRRYIRFWFHCQFTLLFWFLYCTVNDSLIINFEGESMETAMKIIIIA